ncbi:hypothetical protein D9758_018621 [Tetrapyrgos nigripes]|uniref:Uncharacterized protein n=1 Tax=Tetrapyrgos nigripes TaxID=182062 RepID=A0A8H5C361_9AGAR|nr:hypothetical protein D9758_018621 [Tetrapyrgos nigripes]
MGTCTSGRAITLLLRSLCTHRNQTFCIEKRNSQAQSLDIIGSIRWIIQRPDNRTRWDDLRSQIAALATEATIATFLASVQSTILGLSVNNASQSTALTATRALAFMGILLDVISAFLALLSSTLLQAKISEVQRLLDAIGHMSLDDLTKLEDETVHSDPSDPFRKFFVDTPLWESLKFEVLKRIMARLEQLKSQSANQLAAGDPAVTFPITNATATAPAQSPIVSQQHRSSRRSHDHSRSPSQSHPSHSQPQDVTRNFNVSSTLESSLFQVRHQISLIDNRVEGLLSNLRGLVPEISAIRQACQRVENIGSVGDSAGTAILLGGLAFLSSSVCLAIATQPKEVWIPTVVAVGSVLYLPGANMLLKYFDIRLPSVFDTI